MRGFYFTNVNLATLVLFSIFFVTKKIMPRLAYIIINQNQSDEPK